MTEKEIIRSAAAGDKSSFKTIYDRYSDMVWGLSLKFTSDDQLAEDAFAEVFVKLYKKLNKFNFKSSFKTWLYRFTVNTLLNFIKKESRRQHSELKPGLAGDNERKKFHETRETANYLLSKLNPGYRSIMVLRELEGRTYKEIADITDMKLGTVKTNIYRAREELKNIYNEEFKDEL